MSVFSFHPVKPITAGEGGAIVTNDAELARRARLFRNHGIEREEERLGDRAAGFEGDERRPWYFEQQVLGFNYRMTDMQAALATSQLQRLDAFLARRRRLAALYDEAFTAHPLIELPQSRAGDRARSGHHLYPVRIDFAKAGLSRAKLMARLRARDVGSQVHFIPIHRHPFYRERLGVEPADFPVAEAYYADCLSLPLHPGMSDDDAAHVVSVVTELL